MNNNKFYPVRYSYTFREYEVFIGGNWYPVIDFLHDGFDAKRVPAAPFNGHKCTSYTISELEWVITQKPTVVARFRDIGDYGYDS